jgi:predicted MFS family arabinose efflux permease
MMQTVATQPGFTWRPVLAGLSASLVGIGLARFAYTPLIPALIADGWLSPSDAYYAGAANLAGYLLGALAGRRFGARIGARAALQSMMLLATLSFVACALRLGDGMGEIVWFTAWRVAAGVAGGVLMVLAAPALVPTVPERRRGLATGAIFTGVGLGILISGTVMPVLVARGVVPAWLALGAASAGLTAWSWTAWPRAVVAAHLPPLSPTPGLLRVCMIYGLNAAGLTPFMVFLVDYVARGLGYGIAIGSGFWVLFGAGATLGALVMGAIGDRIGMRATVIVSLLVQALSVATPLVTSALLPLGIAAFAGGAFVTGVLPTTLGRVRALLPAAQATAGWSRATVFWAVGQAAAGYAFAALATWTGGMTAVFACGVALLVVALGIAATE